MGGFPGIFSEFNSQFLFLPRKLPQKMELSPLKKNAWGMKLI